MGRGTKREVAMEQGTHMASWILTGRPEAGLPSPAERRQGGHVGRAGKGTCLLQKAGRGNGGDEVGRREKKSTLGFGYGQCLHRHVFPGEARLPLGC